MPGAAPFQEWSRPTRLLTPKGKNSRTSCSKNQSKSYSGREKEAGTWHSERNKSTCAVDAGMLVSKLCTVSVSYWDFMCF